MLPFSSFYGQITKLMTDAYDSPWKDVLERYFAEFMAFFFPAAHAESNG